ncbi:hypothetical protein [Plantibacter sp. Mn2098]
MVPAGAAGPGAAGGLLRDLVLRAVVLRAVDPAPGGCRTDRFFG